MTEVVRGGTNRSARLDGRENTISGACCREKEVEKVKSWSTILHVRPKDAEEVCAGSGCSRSSSPRADLACKAVEESQGLTDLHLPTYLTILLQSTLVLLRRYL